EEGERLVALDGQAGHRLLDAHRGLQQHAHRGHRQGHRGGGQFTDLFGHGEGDSGGDAGDERRTDHASRVHHDGHAGKRKVCSVVSVRTLVACLLLLMLLVTSVCFLPNLADTAPGWIVPSRPWNERWRSTAPPCMC